MEAHANVFVIRERPQIIAPHQSSLRREPQGVGANYRVRGAQSRAQIAFVQRGQRAQRVQGVELRGLRLRGAHQLSQQRKAIRVAPLAEQPRGGVAMPAVRVLQSFHQVFGARAAKPHQLRLRKIRWHDAEDAPAIHAAVQVQFALQLRRQRPRVLDRLAIHVHDVERAVRRVRHGHGPEPVVARGEKLFARLLRCAFGEEVQSLAPQTFAVTQVAAAVCDKRVAVILGWKGVTAINRHAARAGEVTGRAPAALDRAGHESGDPPLRAQDAPRLLGTDAKNLCGW